MSDRQPYVPDVLARDAGRRLARLQGHRLEAEQERTVSLDEAWSEVEKALIAAQGDEDGFAVEIGYWDEFPETPWAVTADDVQVEAATLPAAFLALRAALAQRDREGTGIHPDDPRRVDGDGDGMRAEREEAS